MSSLFIIAPLLGLFASLCILGMSRIVAKRNAKHRHALGCAGAVIAFPILTILLFVWLPRAATSTGIGVSAHVANEGLHTFSVPAAATDVNFRHAFFSGTIDEADFAIDEPAFLAWMKQSAREPQEFHTDADSAASELVWVKSVKNVVNSDELEVRNGYRYLDDGETAGDDSFFLIIYDKDGGRAYVQRTTF